MIYLHTTINNPFPHLSCLFTIFQKFNKHVTEMFKVCNTHNSKSNIVNFINIFSEPNILSSTRSTETEFRV